MSRAGVCPHPEKKRWPLQDPPEGLRCPCGHVWEPYLFVVRVNRYLRHPSRPEGAGQRLEVYRCRERGSGRALDHWHTTDAEKKRGATHGQLDRGVKGAVLSTADIQKPSWNGKRRRRPLSRAERRRYRRHNVRI